MVNKKTNLTEKQELFCQYYVSQEFFANGTQSYVHAYNVDLTKKGALKAAAACAHDNLMKPDILARINEIMDLSGLNDEFVDKQLLFVINQNAELGPKVAAMKEYNALKARITTKIEARVQGVDNFDNLTGRDREKRIAEELTKLAE